MSGSDNGSYGNHAGDRAVNGGPTAAPPARSASPAKRSAADMERGQMGRKQQQQITPGSFSTLQNDGPTDFDEAMLGITSTSNGTDTQGTEIDPFAASNEVSMATNTATTSFELDGSVESSMNGDCHLSAAHKEPYSTEEVVQQVERVYGECNKPIDEGSRGVVISTKWLGRVLSRTREGLTSGQYPKEAREGPVGPVDNSDIIPEGGLQEPLLNDSEKFPFVPLKPGLTAGEEFEIVPHQAYDFIMGEYGYKSKYPIIRYAHDTAIESPSQNIMYETYPPTITIRKVPQPNQATEQTHTKPSGALAALHQRSERKTRGQNSPDDAIRLVSSRSERFQTFLARSKEAAGIPRTTKVRLWRLLNPENVTVELPNQQQATAMSLPTTRQTSPSRAADSLTAQLIVDQDTFQKMNLGTQLEHIDVQDETNNDKYNGKSTMDTIGLSQHQTIILEEQLGGPGGGEFRSDSKKSLKLLTRKLGGSKSESAPVSGRTSPAPTGAMTRGRARRDSRTRGTVGLTNLGNTCYMNSALQCIRSVEELAVFFLSSAYKKEINNDNPLGHNGAMATSYAGVLRGIYNDGATSAFSPSDFKRKLGTIQPLFSGYGQQDSQEFLSFLVDALHEDLNRIKKKPYNENPDSDDKTVHDPQAIIELGEVYRTNHRARNDSVAMDLFSGFYKNTMECPVCDRISITFDPYSLLTVQLPIESTFQHLITFVPLHGSPINHALDIDKNASIKSVKELIASKHPGVQADRLWMTEIYSSKVFKVFEDSTPISEANIVANDLIWLFELDDVPKNLPAPRKQTYSAYYRPTGDDAIVPDMDSPNADCFAVPIFSRHKDSFDNYKLGLHPLYITITREEAKDYEVILKKILIAVSKLTSRPILKEFDDGVSRVVESSGDLRSDEERPGAEDAAGVSDHSAQSEDSYVKVSIDKADLRADSGAQQDDAAMQVDEVESTVPAHFMEPGYFLSPALRHQLFDLKYAKSSEGMHCTSTPAYKEPPFPMHDRVKLSTRRSSVQSSVSDESTTSTGSAQRGNDDNDQSEESDDDSEKPDIVLSEPTMSTPFIMEDDDEEELPLNPLQPRSPRGGRRRAQKGKNKNHNKKNKHQNVKTYGNKDKGRYNSKQIHNYNRSPIAIKTVPDDEGPYYIQLGEGIVLDWHAEALDSLFGGDANTEGDLRGYRLTTDDGKGMPDFHDPELDAKKLKRAERKRHGIDLEDCFVETGKREVLSEDNAWYCNRCKEMRRAAKTLEIWTIPDILVVHLKRFGGNRSFRDKIDVFVDYPIEGLDMTDKVGLKEDGKEYVYDLFAVDNHYGGLGGGHYTALAKNFYDGEWYDYNGEFFDLAHFGYFVGDVN